MSSLFRYISHFVSCTFRFVLSNFERWPSVKYVTSHELGKPGEGCGNKVLVKCLTGCGEGVSDEPDGSNDVVVSFNELM